MPLAMTDNEVKESRVVLRAVQEHLNYTHLTMGAVSEKVGLVDVLYHPNSTMPDLNYITPRKNTAWIPTQDIENGLVRLDELKRKRRIYYVEGLYLPVFAKSLRELGLRVEREISIMTYTIDPDATLPRIPSLEDKRFELVNNPQESAVWWYVWRNAHYDVVTHGIEPVYIGKSLRDIALGNQADIILYMEQLPIGVARITFHAETAHISALAVMHQFRDNDTLKLIQHKAIAIAAQKNKRIVFTSGEVEADRRICREAGFVDSGSIVCYAENGDTHREEAHGDSVGQSAFLY
jgi:hypothetical protein